MGTLVVGVVVVALRWRWGGQGGCRRAINLQWPSTPPPPVAMNAASSPSSSSTSLPMVPGCSATSSSRKSV